jgi:purine-nucleoside phosphorylase
MSHCIIQNSPTGGLIATGSNWYVDSSIIRDSNGDGINASGGLNISGCSILNSNGYGINITYSSGTSVTGNVITNSASYPLRFPAGYLQNLYLNSNSYPINGVNKIMVFGKGTISSSFTVRDDGIPYTIDSMLYVGTHGAPLPVLTIEPGVEVQFAPGAGMLFAWSVGGYGQWGLLNAKGTPEQHIIFKSVVEPAQGWSGINLGEQSGDTLEYVDISNGYVSSRHGTHYMSHCIIQNSPTGGLIATGSNWYVDSSIIRDSNGDGINASGGLNISGCSILNSNGYGINITYSSGTSVTGNVITNSASYPLRFPAGYLQNLYLNSNSYPINGVNKIMVFGKGTISSSFTVRDDGIPYTIDSMLYVGTHGAPLPVLTIEPGVEVQFAPGAGMLFAWSVGGYGQWGLLNAKGTPEQHIIFKSVVEPAQGWSGINLGEQSGDTLEYVDISNGYVSSRHGTHYMSHCIIQNSPTGGLIATGSNWYVDSSIIRDSNGDGINASGGLNISGCSILNSNGYGINITYSSGTSVTGNVITNSASYPLRFPAGYLQNLYLNSNSYPINGVNKIMVFGKGTISSSFTVRDDGIPYTIDSMLYVGTHGAPLPVLTIEPGVEVQFAPGAGMLFAWSVGGYGQWGLLNAKGTPEQHIIFKSVVEPAQGWSGINLGEQSGDTLEYVDISNGYVSSRHGTHYMSHCIIQNSPSHAVISTGSNWNIINCSLINNTTSGFYGSGNITIGNDLNSTCDIYGNAGFNIQNTAGTSINARYNYWGITDSTIIASKISGNVNWIPWADYSFRDNLGTLSGYIVDSDNSNPISEALVAITQPFQREVYTDVSGHYIIRDIPANTPFTLIVSATNYIDRTITGITVPKGQTIIILTSF